MPLTDRSILNLKTTGKQHKHFDGGGCTFTSRLPEESFGGCHIGSMAKPKF